MPCTSTLYTPSLFDVGFSAVPTSRNTTTSSRLHEANPLRLGVAERDPLSGPGAMQLLVG